MACLRRVVTTFGGAACIKSKCRIIADWPDRACSSLQPASADPPTRLSGYEPCRLPDYLRLPRLQREVFLLRAQQGLDYDEIAMLLDTTPGSARVHYHHAAKRLKELIQ